MSIVRDMDGFKAFLGFDREAVPRTQGQMMIGVGLQDN
jgi:hypothetical protein